MPNLKKKIAIRDFGCFLFKVRIEAVLLAAKEAGKKAKTEAERQRTQVVARLLAKQLTEDMKVTSCDGLTHARSSTPK